MEQGQHDNRTKVLYLITKSNLGGAQRYVYDLAVNLPRDRFEPVVAFGGTGKAGSPPGGLNDMLQKADIRTIHIPSLGRNVRLFAEIASFFGILRVLRAEKPNVLHLNSSKAAGLGSLAGRIAGVPRIIYTAHGWPFWEERPAPIRAIIFFLSWLTVMLAHETICVSEFDRKQFAGVLFVGKKLVTIHNGIREADYESRTEARSTLFDNELAAVHAGSVWIGSIAELHPNKNLERAIDAVKLYNESHEKKIFYAIIGEGQLGETLMKRADKHTILLGFVSDAPMFLKAFDIFLLPSIKEGLPYAILEAGAAGLPVVASNVGGIPEIIGEASDGYLINPKDVADIAQGLHKAVYHLTTPAAPGKPLLAEIIREKFSQQEMFAKTYNVYQRPS